ncbi:MAG: hypothetical protein C0404_10020 [Verrucomicrobia bacterium]|nr:hypothetical protein [Verrucomicrobiota bacterium]
MGVLRHMTDIADSSAKCPACRASLPWDTFNTPSLTTCPACQAGILAVVFPSLYRPTAVEPSPQDAAAVEGESTCFSHPARRAMAACEICGKFLCSLCHIRFGSQDLCTSCIESSTRKDKLKTTLNRRVRYDDKALALAVYPLLLFPLTMVTAPIALTISIWRWKAPASILGASRVRMAAAFVVSLLEIVAWLGFASYIYNYHIMT